MKYVYREIREDANCWLYVVGFYDPDGKWHPEKDCETAEEAAERVHYLNGGDK